MVAGWLTKKFSTIFKGPYFLYWKEKREGKKAVLLTLRLRRYILENIDKEVMKEHHIAKALRYQDKAEAAAGKIVDKEFNFAFNVQIDEEKAFGIIGKIEGALAKARKKHPHLGTALNTIESDFEKELARTLLRCENETKDIYWKQLEPVMKLAEKEGDRKLLMAELATMFKTKDDVSRLASLAFTWEARLIRKNLINLKRDETQIENVLSRLDKKGIKPERVAVALRAIVKRITEHAKNEFRNAYLAWKRDFYLNLVLLRLLNLDEEKMWQFVQKRVMPKEPEIDRIKDIRAVKRTLAKNLHVLAQGYRRLVAEIEHLKALVRREQAAIAKDR